MGTNFYLMRKNPTIHETVHIGKRSFGWRMHWDSCDEADWPRWCDADEGLYHDAEGNVVKHGLPFSINSVEDIRAYLRTGEWVLISEDGDVYDDPLAKVDELCAWDGGRKAWNESHPDRPLSCEPNTPSGSRDREGQVFDRGRGFC